MAPYILSYCIKSIFESSYTPHAVGNFVQTQRITDFGYHLKIRRIKF